MRKIALSVLFIELGAICLVGLGLALSGAGLLPAVSLGASPQAIRLSVIAVAPFLGPLLAVAALTFRFQMHAVAQGTRAQALLGATVIFIAAGAGVSLLAFAGEVRAVPAMTFVAGPPPFATLTIPVLAFLAAAFVPKETLDEQTSAEVVALFRGRTARIRATDLAARLGARETTVASALRRLAEDPSFQARFLVIGDTVERRGSS